MSLTYEQLGDLVRKRLIANADRTAIQSFYDQCLRDGMDDLQTFIPAYRDEVTLSFSPSEGIVKGDATLYPLERTDVLREGRIVTGEWVGVEPENPVVGEFVYVKHLAAGPYEIAAVDEIDETLEVTIDGETETYDWGEVVEGEDAEFDVKCQRELTLWPWKARFELIKGQVKQPRKVQRKTSCPCPTGPTKLDAKEIKVRNYFSLSEDGTRVMVFPLLEEDEKVELVVQRRKVDYEPEDVTPFGNEAVAALYYYTRFSFALSIDERLGTYERFNGLYLNERSKLASSFRGNRDVGRRV